VDVVTTGEVDGPLVPGGTAADSPVAGAVALVVASREEVEVSAGEVAAVRGKRFSGINIAAWDFDFNSPIFALL
jgi:hypothetical protein